MSKITNFINKYYKEYGLKNLFGGASFFDKEATINEYLNLFSDDIKPFNTYDELYDNAVSEVGHISFKEKTKNYDDFFYLLNRQDKMVAISVGIFAYYVAIEVNKKGKDIEKVIDELVATITKDKSFDTNNAFDIKYGMGHRMFGHDPATFGLKNIPTNYLIYVKNEAMPKTRKTITVGDFLGLEANVENVSMLDIIWKFYGNESNIFKGILNSLSHIIVHFAKDLFTPDGLPIPFTSLLEKYTQSDDLKYQVLSYRDSFYKKSSDAHLKASDFASMGIIEVLSKMYCELSGIDKGRMNGYKDDFKLIAITTCMVMQLSTLIIKNEMHLDSNSSSKIIDGAKINVPLMAWYMNIIRREIISIYKQNKIIRGFYKKGGDNK